MCILLYCLNWNLYRMSDCVFKICILYIRHDYVVYWFSEICILVYPNPCYRALDIACGSIHRLHEIRQSRQTCLTNFENVWRGAPGSSDKMSSKVIIFAGHFQCKMTDENPKCLTKTPSFVRQNDRRMSKSFREPCIHLSVHHLVCSLMLWLIILKPAQNCCTVVILYYIFMQKIMFLVICQRNIPKTSVLLHKSKLLLYFFWIKSNGNSTRSYTMYLYI